MGAAQSTLDIFQGWRPWWCCSGHGCCPFTSHRVVYSVCGRPRRPPVTAHPHLGTNRFHFDGAGRDKSICLVCHQEMSDLNVLKHMVNEHGCGDVKRASECLQVLERKRALVSVTYRIIFFRNCQVFLIISCLFKNAEVAVVSQMLPPSTR